jgi:hypothetical protein
MSSSKTPISDAAGWPSSSLMSSMDNTGQWTSAQDHWGEFGRGASTRAAMRGEPRQSESRSVGTTHPVICE